MTLTALAAWAALADAWGEARAARETRWAARSARAAAWWAARAAGEADAAGAARTKEDGE